MIMMMMMMLVDDVDVLLSTPYSDLDNGDELVVLQSHLVGPVAVVVPYNLPLLHVRLACMETSQHTT